MEGIVGEWLQTCDFELCCGGINLFVDVTTAGDRWLLNFIRLDVVEDVMCDGAIGEEGEVPGD